MLAPNELSYSIMSLSPYFHSPSNHISLPLLQNGHPILTRAKTGKSRPKVFLVHTDPATIKQALMCILGIEVHHQTNDSLLLMQTKCIWDILSKVNMSETKGVHTPTTSSCKLSKHGTNVLPYSLLYRSTVGALQYVTLTRPDITFWVNKVCQFMPILWRVIDV